MALSLAQLTIPQLQELPDYGDLMPLSEWLERVRHDLFMDYDGYGYWATVQGYDPDERIWPSKLLDLIPPKAATHVLWFNR